MIFGYDCKATVIAAGNMFGYDIFTGEDFVKPFVEGETLQLLYPPDHGNSGSNFEFDSHLGSTVLGIFAQERGRSTVYHPETAGLIINPDSVYPYQSEIDITTLPTFNSGLRPISDRDVTADNGIDSFLLKGSVIVGSVSGAKRFYAGPFKGFTKEIECVCEGATAVNELDGMDCKGNLKGSYYEDGFSPVLCNLFNYSDQPRTIIDVATPFNPLFMSNTPYSELDYTWINTRNRFKRPVPYSMESDSGKGVSAVLISSRHAIVSASTDIDNLNLRFYSAVSGFITPTVSSSVNTFKQMWDVIGFVDENSSAEVLAKYNEMAAYFDDIKVITFTGNLPSDIQPIQLIDAYGSSPVFYGLAIGQEARGHHGTFCPPFTGSSFNPSVLPTLLFKGSDACVNIPSSELHEMGNTVRTTAVVRGDNGSPVITYYRGKPVFLGLVTGAGYTYYSDPKKLVAFASLHGTGIGSSKPITFPWGTTWTPISFLNQYLSLSGVSAKSVVLTRETVDTNQTYPYPSVAFGTVAPTSKSRRAQLRNTDPSVGVKISEGGLDKFVNKPYLQPESNGEIGTTVTIDFTA
jgi:hypothetical protein